MKKFLTYLCENASGVTIEKERLTDRIIDKLEWLNDEKNENEEFSIDPRYIRRFDMQGVLARNENKDIVGFLLYQFKESETTMNAFDIIVLVDEDYEGQGIGKRMVLYHLRMLEEKAKRTGKELVIKSFGLSLGGAALHNYRKREARIAQVVDDLPI